MAADVSSSSTPPTSNGDVAPLFNRAFPGASAVYRAGAVEDENPVTGLIVVGGTEIRVSLSPNPTQQLLRLDLRGDLTQLDGGTMRVYSMSGQELVAKAWTATDSGLDVGALSPGTYVLTFDGEEFSYSETFVKL